MSPYLSQNTKNLIAALHSTPRPQAILEQTQRLCAQIRKATDRQQAFNLLLSMPTQIAIARSCVDVLVKQSDGTALAAVLKASTSATYASLSALKGLAAINAHGSLRALVSSRETPYSLQRRAVELLYDKLPDEDAAAEILLFLSNQKNARRKGILTKRAFLTYYLSEDGQALDLLDDLFSMGCKSGWLLSIYGHCLQRLGRFGDARKAYSKCLRMEAKNEFARAQRIFLDWCSSDIGKARRDVGKLRPYTDQKWIVPIAGEVLRLSQEYDQANEWFRSLVEDGERKRLGLMLRSHLFFCRGLIGEAIEDYRILRSIDEPASYDTIDVGAWQNLARLLRTCGHLEDAVTEYSKMIDCWGEATDLLERAESLLARGAFADADRDIEAVRSVMAEYPFQIYLEGLSSCLQGDGLALKKAAVRALNSPEGSIGAAGMRNRALYLLAAGDADQAKSILLGLVKEQALDEVRLYAVPYLETLSRAAPDRSEITALLADLRHLAWPAGWVVDAAKGRREEALKNVSRQAYPFPMYCQQYMIAGLQQDKDLAERVLSGIAIHQRSIALWTLGRPDRVYGQCNFAKDPEAQNNLKFCDETKTMLHSNLRIFIDDFDVQQLLFMEEDLRIRFENAAMKARLSVDCKMIEL
ncbi:hypothetical protein BMW22_20200 [Rhizobium leguminosarum]|uniref:Tetratricopeptide repeat protein n=2 Tax=Rhizobium leguminosarum TaxID=384 RepID=A0A1L3ZDG5_RHILE|nr:hypothetical protein BMW22_20200 [Rhizobium leguminosarum]